MSRPSIFSQVLLINSASPGSLAAVGLGASSLGHAYPRLPQLVDYICNLNPRHIRRLYASAAGSRPGSQSEATAAGQAAALPRDRSLASGIDVCNHGERPCATPPQADHLAGAASWSHLSPARTAATPRAAARRFGACWELSGRSNPQLRASRHPAAAAAGASAAGGGDAAAAPAREARLRPVAPPGASAASAHGPRNPTPGRGASGSGSAAGAGSHRAGPLYGNDSSGCGVTERGCGCSTCPSSSGRGGSSAWLVPEGGVNGRARFRRHRTIARALPAAAAAPMAQAAAATAVTWGPLDGAFPASFSSWAVARAREAGGLEAAGPRSPPPPSTLSAAVVAAAAAAPGKAAAGASTPPPPPPPPSPLPPSPPLRRRTRRRSVEDTAAAAATAADAAAAPPLPPTAAADLPAGAAVAAAASRPRGRPRKVPAASAAAAAAAAAAAPQHAPAPLAAVGSPATGAAAAPPAPAAAAAAPPHSLAGETAARPLDAGAAGPQEATKGHRATSRSNYVAFPDAGSSYYSSWGFAGDVRQWHEKHVGEVLRVPARGPDVPLPSLEQFERQINVEVQARHLALEEYRRELDKQKARGALDESVSVRRLLDSWIPALSGQIEQHIQQFLQLDASWRNPLRTAQPRGSRGERARARTVGAPQLDQALRKMEQQQLQQQQLRADEGPGGGGGGGAVAGAGAGVVLGGGCRDFVAAASHPLMAELREWVPLVLPVPPQVLARTVLATLLNHTVLRGHGSTNDLPAGMTRSVETAESIGERLVHTVSYMKVCEAIASKRRALHAEGRRLRAARGAAEGKA